MPYSSRILGNAGNMRSMASALLAMSAVVRRINSRPLAMPFSLAPSFAENACDEENDTLHARSFNGVRTCWGVLRPFSATHEDIPEFFLMSGDP